MKVWNIESIFCAHSTVYHLCLGCVTEILCVFGLYPWYNVIFGDV